MDAQTAYRFGPFVLNPSTLRLRSALGDAALSPRATDLLLMLVREPARLFTKDEIFQRLWPDVAVTDNALTQVISELRRVLGDTPASARYVQTLARRGYRFVAPVECVSEPRAARRQSGARVRQGAGRDVRTIRVLDFVNVSRDRPLGWLSTGIAEALTNGLRLPADLRVVERLPARPGWVDAASDFVVVGAFQSLGARLRITARVVDERTREAIAHAMVDGARQAAFALEDALARDLTASLELALRFGPAHSVGATARG